MVVVWVYLIVIISLEISCVVSYKPPSIDEFDVEGYVSNCKAISTDMGFLRLNPICFPFDSSREVVFEAWGYDVGLVCVGTVFFPMESEVTMIQVDCLAAW